MELHRVSRLLLHGAAAATLVAGTGIAPVAAAAPATAEEVLVDEDFGVRLRPPGSDWSLISRKDIQKIAPDAIMGAVGTGGTYMMVVVTERLSDDPDVELDMVVGNVGEAVTSVGDVSDTTLGGLKGRRQSFTATLEGMRFRYDVSVVLRGKFAYRLMCWGASAKLRENDPVFALCRSALTILEGEAKGRHKNPYILEDADGPGWAVRKGEFRDVPSRLGAKPSSGVRIITDVELRQMNGDAVVGMALVETEAYGIVIAEYLPGIDQGEMRKVLTEGTMEAVAGSPVGKPLPGVVGGVKMDLVQFIADAGVDFRFFYGVHFERDWCYQFQLWCPEAVQAKVAKRLPEMLGTLRFLDDGELAEAREWVDEGARTMGFVSGRACYRGGTYVNFPLGLRWTQPAGAWAVTVGDAALELGENILVQATHLTLGVQILIMELPWDGSGNELLHDAMREGMFEDSVVRNEGKVGKGTLGGLPALESTFVLADQIGAYHHRMLTLERPGAAVVVMVIRPVHESVKATADGMGAAKAVLAGVQLERGAIERVSARSGRFEDRRLGYVVKGLGADWQMLNLTPPEVAATTSVYFWSRKDSGVAVMAGAPGDAAGGLETILVNMLQKFAAKQFGAEAGKAKTRKGSLAGRPATIMEWTGKHEMTIWLTLFDGRYVSFMRFREAGATGPAPPGPEILEILD